MTNIYITGVNLELGSKVLLNAPDTFTMEEMQQIKAGLEGRFPGVDFVFLQGMEVVGVFSEMPVTLELES